MTADRDIERLLDAWFADGPMRGLRPCLRRGRRTRAPPATTARVAPPPWRVPSCRLYLKYRGRGARAVIARGRRRLRRPRRVFRFERRRRAPTPSPVAGRPPPPQSHPPHRRAPCPRRGTRRQATEPGSCLQAGRRPGSSGPAPRSPSRKAGSMTATSRRLLPVPGHARQRSRVRPLQADRPETSSWRRLRTTCSPSAKRPGCSRARRRPR